MAKRWKKQEVTYLKRYAEKRHVAELAERFPAFQRRIADVRPHIDQVNRLQIGLLSEFRAAAPGEADQKTVTQPLLMSMNCIAAGMGWTG